jgi:hypothetical protein
VGNKSKVFLIIIATVALALGVVNAVALYGEEPEAAAVRERIAIDAGADSYLNGHKLALDADDDTSLTADTDDQVDVEISGADDFRFTANTFTALSGSTIQANTIAETTSASGVTIDSVLLKDTMIYARVPVSNATGSGTVTAADTMGWFSNQGASVEITFTLPSAAVGLNYCFYVSAAYTVNVDTASGDQIHHLTNAAGDRIQNAGTAGDSVCLVASDTTYWNPLGEIGTWSDAD